MIFTLATVRRLKISPETGRSGPRPGEHRTRHKGPRGVRHTVGPRAPRKHEHTDTGNQKAGTTSLLRNAPTPSQYATHRLAGGHRPCPGFGVSPDASRLATGPTLPPGPHDGTSMAQDPPDSAGLKHSLPPLL